MIRMGLLNLVALVIFVFLIGSGPDQNGGRPEGSTEITAREMDPGESGIQEG